MFDVVVKKNKINLQNLKKKRFLKLAIDKWIFLSSTNNNNKSNKSTNVFF